MRFSSLGIILYGVGVVGVGLVLYNPVAAAKPRD